MKEQVKMYDKEIPIVKIKKGETFLGMVENYCAADGYFINPTLRWLPEDKYLEEDGYFFKDIEPGLYVIGIQVISDKWINKGFCGWLFNNFGLVINDAYPISFDPKEKKKSMICVNFDHVFYPIHVY